MYSPRVILAVVVFPDPFGPMSVTICPLFISNVTPFTNHLSLANTPTFSNFTRELFICVIKKNLYLSVILLHCYNITITEKGIYHEKY